MCCLCNYIFHSVFHVSEASPVKEAQSSSGWINVENGKFNYETILLEPRSIHVFILGGCAYSLFTFQISPC